MAPKTACLGLCCTAVIPGGPKTWGEEWAPRWQHVSSVSQLPHCPLPAAHPQGLYAGTLKGLAEGALQASENSCGRLLAEPAGGIGLQACRLESTDPCLGGSPERPVVFEAGTPWWRQS
ncbi:hypothetical protein ABPG77_009763 [Micractinium sp. CCAP 211/92]